MAEAPVFTPTPAGVSGAAPAALKKVKIVVTATARAAAEARKNVNVNEPDPNDPTKPKTGTLKGVQAAENVYRRRLQQQYILNPQMWFLRLLIQARTEELVYCDATKKLLYHESSAPIYGSFEEYQEAEARVQLHFEEFIEGRERIKIWDEYIGESRYRHRIFADRMSIFLSEISLRTHIHGRGLELQNELIREARSTLSRNTVEDAAYRLFRREHREFLERVEVVFEECTVRSRTLLDRDAELLCFAEQCRDQRALFDEETLVRAALFDEFAQWFVDDLEPLYEQAVILDEETTSRRRLDAEVDGFLDMAFDALHRLLDLFYQDRVEQRRKAEEAEAQRRAAEAAALAQLLQRHHEERVALEKEQHIARFNEVAPTLERRRVTDEDRAQLDGTVDDHYVDVDESDGAEYRLMEVGPPLGFEFVEAREREHLYELFEQERWAVEQQMASDAQQQERMYEQSLQRRIRVEQEEASARTKLYETLRAMDVAFLEARDVFLVAAKELCALEEDQRATLEWAEVESRLVVSKLAPKRGVPAPKVVEPAPAAVKTQPVAAEPVTSTAAVAPAQPTVQEVVAAPPSQTLTSAQVQQPQQQQPPQVVMMAAPPAGYTVLQMPPAGPTPMPYRQAPHWDVPGRTIVYVQGPPMGPATSGHPLPTVGPQLPFDSKLFKRTGPDGGAVSMDLKAAEDEVESMVTAATLPLGILEYELRARWARTKQQLVDAIQQKLIEPLHQLAAELPDGEDIARRARAAVPPYRDTTALDATPPPSLGWSNAREPPSRRRLAPFLTPPPQSSTQRKEPQSQRRSPGRPVAILRPTEVPEPDEALAKLRRAEQREAEMREKVLQSMRGMLSTKLAPLPAGGATRGPAMASTASHHSAESPDRGTQHASPSVAVVQPWNANAPQGRGRAKVQH